ncbi:HAD domain-containing protein [Capnocytophaga canis]|uniref:HAD domain-containing protein n=1 Tax=Capnocytophaga canis TaxID=1848903 RepID=UPI001AC85ECA|nr:HAD domain-containing protein [Capnocytophaga canis]GIM62127.1 hypothetical protein CAPN008_21770 [Capnocytophaga canis]
MQKIIFLDFDGVLNSGDNSRALSRLSFDDPAITNTFIAGFEFDERCVRWLTYIINSTGAKIVVSSSWRLNYTLEEMRAIWKHFNLPGELIGYTPFIDNEFAEIFDGAEIKPVERGKEIEMWLNRNKTDKYCIIDDDFDMLPNQIFVQTDPEFGLTYETAKLVVEYLTD